MDTGELWTRWTVRLAMTLYVMSLAVRGFKRPWLDASRLLWTVGCLAYLVHVGCAFAFYHHWSHADAYRATAQRTEEMTGFAWGGGLYANYAFTLVWIADVAWWWLRSNDYVMRSRWIEWGVQGYMAFIAFNAVVIFGNDEIRWAGIAACVMLAVVWASSEPASQRASEPAGVSPRSLR
jgi:hypothetical protein